MLLTETLSTFALDIDEGLSATPKRLPSKYFYDKKGDQLFQQIMKLPEYYLTNCEFEIFKQNATAILETISSQLGTTNYEIIELGAGDGMKVKLLLKEALNLKHDIHYIPVDISQNALDTLSESVQEDLPELSINPLKAEYFTALKTLSERNHIPKVILFLGGNIGNFTPSEAVDFIKELQKSLNKGDLLLLGADLKKDPAVIRKAYNDTLGVTRAFNFNLLDRINDELNGDFNRMNFDHYPSYDPATGSCKSYLISQKEQTVSLAATEKTYSFKQWEYILVEISQKYAMEEIQELSAHSGMKFVGDWKDCRHYFTDSLFQK